MNTANVGALAALIREVDGNHDLGAGALAEALAARGVLVPDVLTDAEVAEMSHRMPETGYSMRGTVDEADRQSAVYFRGALEVIAKTSACHAPA